MKGEHIVRVLVEESINIFDYIDAEDVLRDIEDEDLLIKEMKRRGLFRVKTDTTLEGNHLENRETITDLLGLSHHATTTEIINELLTRI